MIGVVERAFVFNGTVKSIDECHNFHQLVFNDPKLSQAIILIFSLQNLW